MTANNKDKRKRTKKSGVFKRLEQKRINKIKREFFERIKPVILDIQSNMSEPIKPAVWICSYAEYEEFTGKKVDIKPLNDDSLNGLFDHQLTVSSNEIH